MEKRKSTVKLKSVNTPLSKKDGLGSGMIFESWSLIQREPHPESRDNYARAANHSCKELKFG
ncbi:hypothetical protein [Legionella sp. W05-934-2]|uniref:hypothetical protein n=1 Tax=Legionella sp. W05-934-2 TaxID=1198649 RepID=UPI003461F286